MQVVWLKRDLRLHDHQPFTEAVKYKEPVLIIYVMEPSIWQAGDLSKRHAAFVLQSLTELQGRLKERGTTLYTTTAEMEPVLEEIYAACGPFTLHAHEEHGAPNTFARDIRVREWMKDRGLPMKEYPPFGVTRGLKDRNDFTEKWTEKMERPELAPPASFPPPPRHVPALLTARLASLEKLAVPGEHIRYGQEGGESLALETMESFLEDRFLQYQTHISKPLASSTSCSRLSPYLAWGNISYRRVFRASRATLDTISHPGQRRQLEAFLSRLHWHCHFIQRLEDEPEIAGKNMNRAFDEVRTEWDEESYQRWLQGTTGFPMIDASMRCLHKTGWVNFRSRAMLVSFVCNTLLLDWKRPAEDLAKLFLDYEPGIHYSQMQMQSGTTGFNTIRIYNPVKQGKDQDPEGRFVRRYIKELDAIPDTYVHEPWKDPHFFHRSYTGPMVDIMKANRRAREVLWSVKQSTSGQEAAQEKLKKHGSRARAAMYEKSKDTSRKKAHEQLSLFDFSEED